jgi:hypothetical protein
MAMPGFSAADSLQPSVANYTNGAVWNGGDPGAVSPEVLDFIKEAFESVGTLLSGAAQVAVSSVASAWHGLNSLISSHEGSHGDPFICSTFVGEMLECSGGAPAMAAADMTTRCVSRVGEDVEFGPACVALGAAVYALALEYCKNPGLGKNTFIQQACPH